MKVKDLIKQLELMPQEIQIRDTFGSPIFWIVKKEPTPEMGDVKEGVYLEPVSQMDVEAELDAFFGYCRENGVDEYDAFLQLGEKGITLEDLKGTSYYGMAEEFSRTHSWY